MHTRTKESKNNVINFKSLLWKSGFADTSMKGNELIAEFLNVSTRTIRRWIKNNKPSKSAIQLLENRKNTLNDHWRNFRISGNEILTPNGYAFTTNQLQTLAIKIAHIKALEEQKTNRINRNNNHLKSVS